METVKTVKWQEFTKAYVPTIIVWVTLSAMLALPKYSFPVALLQAAIILCWSYGGHVLAHKISSTGPLSYINPHVFLHHNKSILLPRPVELLIESITNFLGFFIIFILQKIADVEFFSPSLLIGAAFLYITIHILDYSLRGNEDHGQHHVKSYCNYNPEFFDTLFDTRCEPEKPYTNMAWEIPHAIVAFATAALVKIAFRLD